MKWVSGFTLVEIMLVILIIGMFCATAVPLLDSFLRDVSIEEVTKEIRDFLTSAREQSVMLGKVYRVCFDVERMAYWIEEGIGGDKYRIVTDDFFSVRAFERDVVLLKCEQMERYGSRTYCIRFYPDGTSDPGRIYVGNASGRVYCITNPRIIGTVEIHGVP